MNKILSIFCDGGSRGNPGPAGIGAVLECENERVANISEYLGIATNNVAEYTALVKGLEKGLELGFENAEVKMDSELVVKQILGQYKVKNEGLRPLFLQALALSKRYKTFKISHIRREYNKEADRLANEAMDKKQ
jgi:ribonuclease HI